MGRHLKQRPEIPDTAVEAFIAQHTGGATVSEIARYLDVPRWLIRQDLQAALIKLRSAYLANGLH